MHRAASRQFLGKAANGYPKPGSSQDDSLRQGGLLLGIETIRSYAAVLGQPDSSRDDRGGKIV